MCSHLEKYIRKKKNGKRESVFVENFTGRRNQKHLSLLKISGAYNFK